MRTKDRTWASGSRLCYIAPLACLLGASQRWSSAQARGSGSGHRRSHRLSLLLLRCWGPTLQDPSQPRASVSHLSPSLSTQVTETRTGPLGCNSYDNLDSVSSVLLQSTESKLHLQGRMSVKVMGAERGGGSSLPEEGWESTRRPEGREKEEEDERQRETNES